jgi:hypothetical protein
MKKRHEFKQYLKGLQGLHFLLLIFLVSISTLFPQIPLEMVKTTSPPKIDGILDDQVWKKAKGYSEFKSVFPDYGKLPKEKTIIYMAYDEYNLYFAFRCFESDPEKIIGTISNRDTIVSEDLVSIFIDSHGDGQNAYSFTINPRGIQQDGIRDSQGYFDYLPDFIWDSVGIIDTKGYTVEVKIPFNTLRYNNGKVVNMRIGFLRKISRYSEQYVFPEWKPKGSSMQYLGFCQMEGIKYKRILQLLPSVTYLNRRERNVEDDLDSFDEKSLGLTAKIGLTSDLTLDATLNPDFSHIEIDEGQVDVNVRVEPLFEEKRPFFLEGLEHFNLAIGDDFHIEKIINTRKIIEPLWGLKLSGRLGKSNVINALFSVDESPKNTAPDVSESGVYETGYNYYGILRHKFMLKNNSYIGSIYTGKELSYNNGSGDGETIKGYNRVAGLDSRLRLYGFMTLDAFFLYSFNKLFNVDLEEVNKTEGSAFGGRFQYEDRKTLLALGYHELSRNFELETGRLLRKGIRSISPEVERYIYPASKFLPLVILCYYGRFSRDTEYNMDEYSHQFLAEFQLPLSTRLLLGYKLATEVFVGELFNQDTFSIWGTSRPSKQLKLTVSYSSGGWPFYDSPTPFQGKRKTLFISVNLQPSKKILSQFNWTNHIFHGDEVSTGDYEVSIYRNKTVFNINKFLSIRGIIEYDTLKKTILGDALMEFTYIPGTVIHLGYGSIFSKNYQHDIYDRYKETRSSFFFKASYLFRF